MCISEGGCEGCICDPEDDAHDLLEWDPPCRKDIGMACLDDYECWLDSENWCNSLDVCTDGVNGRDCGIDNDCLSEYCEGGICKDPPSTGKCPDENTWYCENNAVYKCQNIDGELKGKVVESCIGSRYCDPNSPICLNPWDRLTHLIK